MSSSAVPKQSIAAILPLTTRGDKEADDLQRASLLLRTLRHFFNRDQVLDLHVVTRPSEVAIVEDGLLPFAAPWLSVTVHDETIVQPILAEIRPNGWYAQQIVKMSVPDWLGAPAWITFDSDVICARPFGIADIVPGGRALIQYVQLQETGINPDWMKASRDVLGLLAPFRFAMHATPLIYTQPIMRATFAMIEARFGQPWSRALLSWDNLKFFGRVHGHGWAEHSLYFGTAVQTGLLRHLHAIVGVDAQERLVGFNGLWETGNWRDWDPGPSFRQERPGIFEVCNSYTGVPAAFVTEKVEPFLAQSPPEPSRAASPATGIQPLLDRDDEMRQTPDKLRARIVSARPLVIAGPYDRALRSILSKEVLKPLADLEISFLVSLPYTFSAPWDAARLAARIARRAREFPRHRFMILCNEQIEINNFRELGVACALVSHNAMVCDLPFTVDGPESELKYDALYNASFLELKRHELAAGVANAAFLFADWHDSPETEAQMLKMRALMPHATFVNQPTPQDDYRFVDRDGLAEVLRRSRVGLCLSQAEGALRASIEYLMAGLSVVSTPSIGGRDVFFDPHYCLVVDPTPEAVAAGVAELKRRNVPREFIRRRTQEKLAVHRQTMVDIVRGLAAQAGHPPVQSYDWPWMDYDAMHKSYDSAGLERAVRDLAR